jgi:hypothetical protein
MLNLNTIKPDIGRIEFREKRLGIYKVIAPFFHEDGDMYDIFIEELPDKKIKISDYGLTLMKLSYTFDIQTENKLNILEGIISQNRAKLVDGCITLEISQHQFPVGLNQFAQLISKVSNMDIMSREVAQSLFYDYLREFIYDALKAYDIAENYIPTSDKELIVDYKINAQRPIFVFGVNENTKASKVIISCLNYRDQNVPYKSLIIHEDIDKLNKFNRAQITNVSDKQFATLDGFRKGGFSYIANEISA